MRADIRRRGIAMDILQRSSENERKFSLASKRTVDPQHAAGESI